MRRHQFSLVVAAAVPLLGVEVAAAKFVGIQSKLVPGGGPGAGTFRIYAVFDNPGQDEMLAVSGTPPNPLSVTVPNGTFYQHPQGGDTAPSDLLLQSKPDLAYDTFVTIGVKSVGPPLGQPADETTLSQFWPGFDPSELFLFNDSWSVPSGSPQADPFDPVHSFPGTGRILIAQFTTIDGSPFGTMLLTYRSDGVVDQYVVGFSVDYTDCNGPPDCPDHPCFGSTQCQAGSICMDNVSGTSIKFPTPDCNCNLVLDSCDIDFGTSQDSDGNGVPDECDPGCPWDCSFSDGQVGVLDLLALIGNWGGSECLCDIDGGGVGVTDLLALLSHWGPCP